MAQSRYLPYGQTHWLTGTLATDFHYTSQRQEMGFGLYDYNARYYGAYLNRFVSPDSIVPNPTNPQSLNRYSYVLGNPLKYKDSSGHTIACGLNCDTEKDDKIAPPPPPEELPPQNLPPEDNGILSDVVRPWELGKMDAAGFRLNGSLALLGGFNANLDVIANVESQEISLFFTPGLIAGMVAGFDASFGLFEVANLPNNEAYQGVSVNGGGTVAVPESPLGIPLGIVAEYGSIPPAIDSRPLSEKPQTWFGGYSLGAEAGAYVAPSLAVEIIRVSARDGQVITILPQVQRLLGLEP